jgi:hypothetical protein
MTTSLLFLFLLFVAVIALGLALWRLGPGSRDTEVDLRVLTEARPACRTYEPLSRLFAAEDTEFLRRRTARPGALRRRLGRQRRRVLSLYLRQLSSEFREIWKICRLLAPMSNNPDFGALVTKQFLTFYGLYWTLQLRCLLGALVPVHVNAADLVTPLRQLEQATQRVFQALEPEAQAAALGA